MKAYCFADGVIGFARTASSVPDGAVVIADGPAKQLRDAVSVLARHAYDGVTLLVPGVPEAESQDKAMDALLAWCTWAAEGNRGVTFVGGAA